MSNLDTINSALDSFLIKVHSYPLLTKDEEYNLAVDLCEKNDKNAANRLVSSNLRFVVKIAKEYSSYGLKLIDLIQEGAIGLIFAVRKFNPYKGFRLISYAVWWIRAFIQNYILNNFSIVKIATTQAQRKLFYGLAKAKEKIFKLTGESLTDNNVKLLSNNLNVREKEVIEMDKRLNCRDSSLDMPLSAGSNTERIDMIVEPDQKSAFEVVYNGELKSELTKRLSLIIPTLNEKEKYIFDNRLASEEPLTLQVIGDRFKITRERARQIEENLRKKLRVVLRDMKF